MPRVISIPLAIAALGLTLAGCSNPLDHKTAPTRVAETARTPASTPTPSRTRTPPSPTPTAVPSQAPVRRARPTHATPTFTACDANIEVKAATTTCRFAENTFYEYWTDSGDGQLQVWSPAAGRYFTTACADAPDTIVCTTDDGGEVRFSEQSLLAYRQDQADRYAASHVLGPDGGSSDGSSSPDAGVKRSAPEDDGSIPDYSDAPSPDTGPTPDSEIPNYDNGNGYPVECADGMWSKSGGLSGACSGHGGEG
jgi:hypothetical protein